MEVPKVEETEYSVDQVTPLTDTRISHKVMRTKEYQKYGKKYF